MTALAVVATILGYLLAGAVVAGVAYGITAAQEWHDADREGLVIVSVMLWPLVLVVGGAYIIGVKTSEYVERAFRRPR